jgi:SHS2 domain-containing protein
MPNYKVIEHTADAGIAACGTTKAEAFAHAAEGMYSLMVNPADIRERAAREIAAKAPDDARLLERWLQELLFITDTDGLLFARFEVSIEDGQLKGVAYGEPIDRQRHELCGDIKGVTKHMTNVEEIDGGYRVRVLLDM